MNGKIINNKEFKTFLKNILTPDIFYFNKDMLQITYKDIAGVTLILSSINSETLEGKFSASLFSVATVEGGRGKTTEIEHIYSPKDLFLQIFNNSDYSKHFKVLKVRMSDVGKKSTHVKKDNNGSIIELITVYDSVLRLLKNEMPRKIEDRKKEAKYFEDIYVYLEPCYTSGLLKDYLFNKASYWHTTKPDIEADDFYLICLDTISFDSVRDVSEESKFYDLIYPLAVLRVKNKNITS